MAERIEPTNCQEGSTTVQTTAERTDDIIDGKPTQQSKDHKLRRPTLQQSEKEFTPEPGTKVFTLKDIPPRPQLVLRLTLKQKTYWESFIEKVRTFSPRELFKALYDEKRRILTKAKRGETITDDEIDFLNKAMTEEIDPVFDSLKKQVKEVLRIEQSDDSQTILFKVSLTQQLLKWLEALFEWMMEKISSILEMAKTQGTEWCIHQAKEVFETMLVAMTEEN